MTNSNATGKPYAGNPHARFDAVGLASVATPRRGTLLCNAEKLAVAVVAVALSSLLANAGESREVRVSDFGCDAEDATRFVQAALDSGAKRVVFDAKGSPWVVKPVRAHSDTDIVFEDGVVLLAKKGEFHGKRDYLLDMTDVTNVTLVGLGPKGGTLRMNKPDYQKPPYTPSEWRYALSLLGARQVRVENMSFIASGGDGICLGRSNCKDIVIRHCRCVSNHRQGISVCGAENLLVEDCDLVNTSGTAPSAGIDFEPDKPSNSIANCTIRNCRIKGNRGKGVDIFLRHQNEKSKPIGIRVENCYISDNSHGADIVVGNYASGKSDPRGEIVFSGCTFEANRGAAISVRYKPTNLKLEFNGCTITNSGSCVAFEAVKWHAPIPDGVSFRDLKVYLGDAKGWFTPKQGWRGLNSRIPQNITGNIDVVQRDGSSKRVVIDREWCQRTFAAKNAIDNPVHVAGLPSVSHCRVCDEKPGEMVALAPVELHWGAKYVFFAEKAGEVRFRARQVPKDPGAHFLDAGPVVVKKPTGKKSLASLPSPSREPRDYAVSVPARGFYAISATASRSRFLLEAADVPVAVHVPNEAQQMFITGPKTHALWVCVPKRGKFSVLAKGGSDGCLGAALFTPDGALAGRNDMIKGWETINVGDAAPGLWRLNLEKPKKGPRKYFYLDLVDVPALFWLAREKTVQW